MTIRGPTRSLPSLPPTILVLPPPCLPPCFPPCLPRCLPRCLPPCREAFVSRWLEANAVKLAASLGRTDVRILGQLGVLRKVP